MSRALPVIIPGPFETAPPNKRLSFSAAINPEMSRWQKLAAVLVVGRVLTTAVAEETGDSARPAPFLPETSAWVLGRNNYDDIIKLPNEAQNSNASLIAGLENEFGNWMGPTSANGCAATTANVTTDNTKTWHPRLLDLSTFTTIKTLQPGRILVGTHPSLPSSSPVLLKMATVPHEAHIYHLLHGSGATPEFLGHGVQDSADGHEEVVGFVTEYIPQERLEDDDSQGGHRARQLEGCLDALRKMHARGIAHGDAHDGNCLVREGDGEAVLIDFELAVETGDQREFERDLDVMGRCIMAAGSQA
jgi:hypothetical protein